MPRKAPTATFIHHLAILLASGILCGCPRDQDPAVNRPAITRANSEDIETAADASASPAGSEQPEQTDKLTQPMSNEAREKFIAKMREMGVSVELDDENYVISLVMGFTKIDDAGLAELPELPRLDFIGIDHTNITDKGVAALAMRTSLRTVYLGGNDISGKGLKHLTSLKNLEYLDLSDLPIGDEALAPLADLKSLSKLNLTSTKVTLEGTIAFSKKLPGLEVSAPFGNLVGGSRLTMDPGVEDTELAKLKSLESLRELNLWECDNITDAGMNHVVALSQLTTLELGYTKVTDDGLAKLVALENLKQLDVRETDTSVAAVLRLVAQLGNVHVLADWGTVDDATSLHFVPETTDEQLTTLVHLPRLARLNLWRCDQLTDAAMTSVAKCTNLRELNIGATNIGDDGIVALQGVGGLRRLILANTSVTDAGVAEVGKFASLEELDLSSTAISDEGVDSLHRLSALRSLNLAGTALSDEALPKLAPLAALENLNLAETNIGLSDIAVKENLGRLPKLRRVDLSLTLVSDKELSAIAACQNIEELDLWGTRVTDEGLKHLHNMTQLKRLGLFGTPVADAAVADLKKALKNVEVVHEFVTVEE